MLKPARTLVWCVTDTATSPPTPNRETFTAAPRCPKSAFACGADDCEEGCTAAGVSVEGAVDDTADWPYPARQLDANKLQTIAVERTNRRITVSFLLELRCFVVWRKLNIAPISQGSTARRE